MRDRWLTFLKICTSFLGFLLRFTKKAGPVVLLSPVLHSWIASRHLSVWAIKLWKCGPVDIFASLKGGILLAILMKKICCMYIINPYNIDLLVGWLIGDYPYTHEKWEFVFPKSIQQNYYEIFGKWSIKKMEDDCHRHIRGRIRMWMWYSTKQTGQAENPQLTPV